MNKIKITFLAVSILFLSYGVSSAQVAATDLDLENAVQLVDPIEIIGDSIVLKDGLVFFFDEGKFNTTCNEVSFEDFQPNNRTPNSIAACASLTLNSETDDNCFSPGDLISGFTVTSDNLFPGSPPMILINPSAIGFVRTGVGSNVNLNNTIVLFDPPVEAASMFVLGSTLNVNVDIRIFGEGGILLSTINLDALQGVGTFFGVVAPDDLITRIEIDDPNGGNTIELIGDLSFGGCDFTRPIPTLSEWGLIAMATLLGLVGFIALRKRYITA